jgi:hypothetical protein
MKRLIILIVIVSVVPLNSFAYGPRGHSLVGAIADRRVAKDTALANKIKVLLDGLTLERVATLPDEIKSWDGCDKPNLQPKKKQQCDAAVIAKTRINTELRAFVNANRRNPSHSEFHYTDVPVIGNEMYADGEVGRFPFDVVHMIPFCIRVLKGEEPENNSRAITKSIAVILITHYLGDIHQPLHVGAQFFDANGKPFHPTPANEGFADQGGNKLTLFTLVKGAGVSAGKFHSYWDGQTVENAFGSATNPQVAQQLGRKEPKNWKLSGGVETWAEQLANDILPIAREAHQRLEYSNIRKTAGEKDITSGNAVEKKKSGGTFYAVWAGAVVKDEIHRGGWRLAALLEEVLR